MAQLASIPLATHCILPSCSSRGLGWCVHMSPTLPCMKARSEVSRLFRDEIACVSKIRASTPDLSVPEFSLTAPPLESLAGRNALERLEIMSIASADAADQAQSLPGADNTGMKFSSVESLKRRESSSSAQRKESAEAEAGRTSIWDALSRAFEKPSSFQTSAVIEESGSPALPLASKGGADPVQFLFVSVALIFIWWLGNYYVPDLVFKNTVFRDQSKDSPLSGETGEAGAELPTSIGFAQTQDRSRKKARKGKRN